MKPFLFLMVAAATIFFTGCEKNDGSNDPPSGPGSITLTVVPRSYDNYKVEFYAIAQQLVIDWGDGSAAETYTNVNWEDYEDRITHTYTDSGTYTTVQIKGEGLTAFDCLASGAISLDISGCTALEELWCGENQLTSLDASKCTALQTLDCVWNQLTSLDVSKCTALEELWCGSNQLTSLNVSGCPALQRLGCSFNQLTSLDVSKCPALQWLYCYSNQLTSLNASKCTALQELYCEDNQLTSLDVSKCTALQKLVYWGNRSTSLDVSECLALQDLSCGGNQLTAAALNTVFTALPNRIGEGYALISIYDNPGSASCNRAIAENKGWQVVY
jgi:Leucine-rich repeat (LRR) protein